MSRIRVGIVVFGFILLTLCFQTGYAATFDMPPAGSAPTAAQQGDVGPGSMVPAPDIRGQDQPMFFEQFNPAAYNLTYNANFSITDPGHDALIPSNATMTGAANTCMFALVLIATGATRLLEWAFSINLFQILSRPINAFVGSMRDNFYTPYVAGAVLLALAWALWTWVVMRRMLPGVQGIVWAVVAMAMATLFFTNPTTFLTNASAISEEISTSIMTTAASGESAYIPGDYVNNYQGQNQSNYAVREFANRMWVVFVYDPYTVAQFGEVDPTVKVNGQTEDLGIELLKANSGQPNNYSDAIKAAPKDVQDWADGNQGGGRVAYAFFVGDLAGGIGMLITFLVSIGLLVAGIMIVLNLSLSGLVWTLAPIPRFGYGVLERWATLILVSLVVKVLTALYLTILLTTVAALSQIENKIGWLPTAALTLAAAWILFHFRKTFFRFGKAAASTVPGMGRRFAPAPTSVPHGGMHALEAGVGAGLAAQGLHQARQRFVSHQYGRIEKRRQAWAGNAAEDTPQTTGTTAGAGVRRQAANVAAAVAKNRVKGAAAASTGSGAATGAATGAAAGGKAAVAAGAGVATAGAALAVLGGIKAAQAGLRVEQGLRGRMHAHGAHVLLGASSSASLPRVQHPHHPRERDMLKHVGEHVKSRLPRKDQPRSAEGTTQRASAAVPPPRSQKTLPTAKKAPTTRGPKV